MYSKSKKKVSEKICTIVLLGVFAVFSVLYFPIDALQLENDEPSSQSLPVIDLRVSFPGYKEVEQNFVMLQKVRSLQERQVQWEDEYEEELTLEEEINSYIDSIVKERYPELDKTTIQAIVYNESHYSPAAVNPTSGTKGLMQISPKWHTERASRLGVTDLLDAYGNILVGCDILAEVTRNTGSFTYALDVFAGGYEYANAYIGSVSPARANISNTVSMINSGEICI